MPYDQAQLEQSVKKYAAYANLDSQTQEMLYDGAQSALRDEESMKAYGITKEMSWGEIFAKVMTLSVHKRA